MENNFEYMERLAKEYDKKLRNETTNGSYDEIIIILEEQLELIDFLLKMAKKKINILSFLRSSKYEVLRLSYKNQNFIGERPLLNNNFCSLERIKERLIELQLELFKLTDNLEGEDKCRIELIENRNLSLLIYL